MVSMSIHLTCLCEKSQEPSLKEFCHTFPLILFFRKRPTQVNGSQLAIHTFLSLPHIPFPYPGLLEKGSSFILLPFSNEPALNH